MEYVWTEKCHMQKWGECHNDRGPDKGHETLSHVNTNSDLNLQSSPISICSQWSSTCTGKNTTPTKNRTPNMTDKNQDQTLCWIIILNWLSCLTYQRDLNQKYVWYWKEWSLWFLKDHNTSISKCLYIWPALHKNSFCFFTHCIAENFNFDLSHLTGKCRNYTYKNETFFSPPQWKCELHLTLPFS